MIVKSYSIQVKNKEVGTITGVTIMDSQNGIEYTVRGEDGHLVGILTPAPGIVIIEVDRG